jgi:hypothetical protein
MVKAKKGMVYKKIVKKFFGMVGQAKKIYLAHEFSCIFFYTHLNIDRLASLELFPHYILFIYYS